MATRTESMPDVRLQERKSFAVLRDLSGRRAHGGTTGGEGRNWGINSPADVIDTFGARNRRRQNLLLVVLQFMTRPRSEYTSHDR